ncbi:hypothetical protein G6L37_04740 [Agrobacterium rubi]|nr:hypothetical protein [Agrobacterium rubi]NTF24661.1 hypothetical protein [Agrobacterium rubi]
MDIEGLKEVVKHRHPHSVLRHYLPVTGGARFLTLETLPTGRAMLELRDGGDLPNEGPAERIFIEFADDDDILERMVRAMAVFHFDLDEAETNLTGIDASLLSRGFELGYEDGGKPCWIRLSSAMNVVIRNEAEDALPVHPDQRISMLCIIPGREQVRFMCENLATAFKVLEKNRAFKTAKAGDGSEMITVVLVDSETVVYH